jgi:hypothetical protein
MKHTMIILEGPDGAGKSTLAQHIHKVSGWPIVHTGGPLIDRADFLDRVERLHLLKPQQAMIVDRTPFISDRVYAVLPPGRPEIASEKDFNDMFRRVRPIIVYCRLANTELMLKNICKTKKEHKTLEYLTRVQKNHPLLVERYDEIMSTIPHLKYDWQELTPPALVSQIAEKIATCVD